MTIEFDDREILAFAKGLEYNARTRDQLRAVVSKAALNIKNDARKGIRGLKHARAYPSSITYDIYDGLKGPFADIGPDKQKRQGALGNILEFGTVNNPPKPHIRPAAQREEPKFAKAIEDVVTKNLEG